MKKLKIMTILGTRPEIIRLSRIIPVLDELCDHVLVHTGQNYDRRLNEIFFEELELRQPDIVLESKSGSFSEQIGKILSECEKVLAKEKPDRLLILGDTNSALSSVIAKRMQIPVFHMEAGNRCYDDRVPEEVNRRIVDHCSDILMPYTERSRANLLKEGIAANKIFVTGNPIKEVLDFYAEKIDASNALNELKIEKGKYFLVTLHRAENVDNEERLENYLTALNNLYKGYNYPVICSLHPRTKSQLEKQKKEIGGEGIRAIKPLGLFDFVNLEKNAFCVLSDSGTVQEECCIFNVPNVTLRDVTERPETVEAGSNIIAGSDPDNILSSVKIVLNNGTDWQPPQEYMANNVTRTVIKILTGFYL